MKSKKGQVTLYIFMIIIAFVIITIAAVLAPMGVLFNTEMLSAGQDILYMANDSISDIQNTEIRDTIQDSIGSATESATYNIEVNNAFFKYSWVLIIGLTALVIFLFSRMRVETGGGGGFV